MLRRDIFRAGLAGAAGLFGLGRANAATPEGRLKVAYHLSDADKVNFVLGNIKNHYEGTGGNVDIVLVVHGPALAAFKVKGASGAVSSRFAGLVQQGLVPQACGNTLHGMDITLTDLLAGFELADKGGVVKLAELQHQGYVYLRP
ncbi:DsrE family protein [Mesorhizobium sp. CA18]|uniref:DsrE family protein n=1 Tax=unclassified Mesorhizobium TaxID=325217 RepID=UPI001CCCEF88|nr:MULTISPECIES: DsrE family protein [unclassified Mesorhizobium]MBZ9732937.1 DsrE family protein [Mesorhizobium sp. CA9]MBZ9824967.1 DsrE family protein [Mesorhizobium sp. CA18]MBZ9830587.1 DsrE family protein [Mesorhizobium sp. CA2]MBZ9836274.1 DsrE family protein [Mesorhizobium sp. CA3]MBZ9859037.1 DsrE family protein [Mesorhizobium sp. CA12]